MRAWCMVMAVVVAGCSRQPPVTPSSDEGEDEAMDIHGERRVGVLDTVAGRFVGEFIVQGGQVFLGDDVTIGLATDADAVGKLPSVGISNDEGLWPDGIVPYVF